MATEHKKSSADENRWWVDQGKSHASAKPKEQHAPAGESFFRSVEHYDQEQAVAHLTDLNLTLLKQTDPAPGEWAYLPLTDKHSSAKEIDKIKRALSLPSQARAVLVDSGLSLRAIITGAPPYERILEFNFIQEASFDCWIHGEWMCEKVFGDKHQLLRHATELLHHFLLEKESPVDQGFLNAPRLQGPLPPGRTDW
jgi:hypothetical protein